jgi:hypothetical protein
MKMVLQMFAGLLFEIEIWKIKTQHLLHALVVYYFSVKNKNISATGLKFIQLVMLI